jgi:predicted nucleotidyltransferase
MSPRIRVDRDKIAGFCRRHRVRKLSLFGSVLREDFRPDSDVDVLVEFEPGRAPGLFGLVEMEQELSALLDGRNVDLILEDSLNRWIRAQALAEAEVQYVEEG